MFRELFDAAPDAMIAIDHAGRIVHANQQAVQLFGYADDELIGAPIEILVPSRARADHENHRIKFADNPRVRPMGIDQELSALKRNGEEFPVEIALSPLQTPDGQIFVASIRDVSETYRTRQALARARLDSFVMQIGRLSTSAPNLDMAVKHIPWLIADALSVPTVAIMCNDARSRTLQVIAEFGLPAKLLDIILPSSIALLASYDKTDTGDQPIIVEDSSGVVSGDAKTFKDAGFGSFVSIPLIDGDEAAGIVLVLSHERRCFDHDAVYFLQTSANLLGAAMQRIRMEEQLAHTQRLEAIGQLTGGIAHDFNNLLTVISGNLEILECTLADRTADRTEAQTMIGNALSAVGRGADLTRKLLAFARRQHLSPSACDPKRLFSELGMMLKRTLGETIELEIACADDIPRVYADPGQLEAALLNLALNSRDAMPRGGRLSIAADMRQHRHLSADSQLVPGDYVIFTVRDTGLGMAPEVLERAFEPFYTTKEIGKGTGLGLSMVYGFARQSGGHVSADSQLGYGTVIELCLPVATAAVEKPAHPATKPESSGRDTILVVEDEPDVRGIAVAFLGAAGYAVYVAENAVTALELIATEPSIALMFSDVVLSHGMNGVELAHEVRRLRPELPIWLTSGYEGAAADDGDGDASAFDLLRKPYRREELLAVVREALDGRLDHSKAWGLELEKGQALPRVHLA